MCNYESDVLACDAFSETTRKARKAHRCVECGCAIVVGERYRYASGIWDGEPASFRQCLDCVGVIAAWDAVSRAVCSESVSYAFGQAGADFAEFVDEHVKMVQMMGDVKP